MTSLQPVSVDNDLKYYQILQQVSANENGFHNEMFGKSHSGHLKWLQLSVDEKVGKICGQVMFHVQPIGYSMMMALQLALVELNIN